MGEELMAIYQISVFLENQAGKLSEVTNILAENGIDLRAINIAESSDYGVLRVITNDSQKTVDVLKDHGFIVTSTPVVVVGVPDEPGGLAKLLRILAAQKFDVEYMYSIFGKSDGLAYMIFKVADPAALTGVLTKKGFTVDDGKALGIK